MSEGQEVTLKCGPSFSRGIIVRECGVGGAWNDVQSFCETYGYEDHLWKQVTLGERKRTSDNSVEACKSVRCSERVVSDWCGSPSGPGMAVLTKLCPHNTHTPSVADRRHGGLGGHAAAV